MSEPTTLQVYSRSCIQARFAGTLMACVSIYNIIFQQFHLTQADGRQ